ncbi:MAG TPA: hypothetical protein ENK49_09105 [Gammaproteobacteria bacterium]|nr:hypothetical protein [Gammaproteobacteria bacterium]
MRLYKHLFTLLILLLAAPVQAARDTQLLERLRADQAALQAARADFARHRETGSLGAGERDEYAAYLERLRERVAADCAALAAERISLPPDLDCPQPVIVPRPAAIDPQAEQTEAERAAALDAELKAGLGEFDQRLLREQERVKAARPRTAGGAGQAGRSGEGGSGDARAEGGGTGAPAEKDERGELARPPTTSGSAGGPGQQSTAGEPPQDVGDGSDDDVVARQLREAAERETDPEMKKKLWEEYRKYKQGTR